MTNTESPELLELSEFPFKLIEMIEDDKVSDHDL